MKTSILCLLAVLTVATVAYGKPANSLKHKPRRLYRGRPVDGGFLPKPVKSGHADKPSVGGISQAKFTQKLDHFDSANNVTWQQRYQINNNYYKSGGPMFVMISGEAPMEIEWMSYGQWWTNAQTYNALMYQLEHRFYGESHPTTDASTANLKYLTSEQALADLDYFIRAMKNQQNIQKVVVFGGSYAGNLAAWYREKYPQTALGSIASSAPVTAEVDFTQYLETVGYTMDYFVPGCQNTVQEAFSQLQTAVVNKDAATVNLFDPCTAFDFADQYGVDTFFSNLINPWMGAVQYSPPDAASSPVTEYCDVVTNTKNGADALHRVAYFYSTYVGCSSQDYQQEIKLLKETEWTSAWVASGTRQWIWQTCNEFGYYQSTDSANQPFAQTVPVAYILDTSCTQVFGQTFSQVNTSAVASNGVYGGINGQEKKVFLPNGSIDPWHNLAIYQAAPDPSDTLGFMNGTSHCYDMGNSLPTDPPQLIAVRNQITAQIAQWLSG